MTSTRSSSGQKVLRGTSDGSDETLPGEPTNSTPDAGHPRHNTSNTSSTATQAPKTFIEEPDMALEPDLPSDGRDEKGEAMIRDLPQRPELSEPPSQPDSSSKNP